MGHGEVAGEHHDNGQSASHPSFHRAFPPSSSHIVDRLVRLKDSDPEMFSEAWNRLPDSTRENILDYLKSYPNLLEKEYPLLLLHRAGKLSVDEVEEFEEQTPMEPALRPASAPEPKQPVKKKPSSQRTKPKPARARAPATAKSQEPNGDVARAPSKTVRIDRSRERDGEGRVGDFQFLAELRKISKQNSVQIELLQRLLRAYEDQE